MILVIFEGLIASFIALLSCVVGKANGAHKMAFFYDEEVQKRVVENGLISKEQIDANSRKYTLFGIVPFFILTIVAIYAINGARGFWDPFLQMCTIFVMEGIFDRLFIDWYWVNHTKAWNIPGTEDLKPYIQKKHWIAKWSATLIGYPMIAAILAFVLSLVIK